MNTYVSYLRVSTDKQGINGLGMDAQRHIVNNFLRGVPVQHEFQEVESGKHTERPQLHKALSLCRKTGAILLIAKLDRLSRDAAFTLNLKESGVEFIACDMPQANRLTIGILALVAEHEAQMISQRTKDGLAAAKRRGIKLGNPNPGPALEKARASLCDRFTTYRSEMKPIIAEIQAAGVSTRYGIAKALNARGIKSVTGKQFSVETVGALMT